MGDGTRWDQFFWQIEPISKVVPWMVSIGNHEYDYGNQPFKPDWSNYGEDSNGECGIPFTKRFHMPNNNSYWWSIDYGNIHFIVSSEEHDFTRGSEQWNWIKNDLSKVNRQKTPFIIFSGHRPMYCSGLYIEDYTMTFHIQSELEDLFYQYQVDLALWGHYHSYERSCNVYKRKCVNDKATVHVVIGMAGMELSPQWINPQPEWSMFRDSTHYGLVTIDTNSSHLNFKFLGNNVVDPIDEFWIKNIF